MSFLDKFKRDKTEASEEPAIKEADSSLEQTEIEETPVDTAVEEDLLAQTGVVHFEPTIHFEISDILNALEHIDAEPAEEPAPDAESAADVETAPAESAEPEEEPDAEPELEIEPEPAPAEEPEIEEVTDELAQEVESEEEALEEPAQEPEPGAEEAAEPEPEAEPTPEEEPELEAEPEPEPEPESDEETSAESEAELEPAPEKTAKPKESLLARFRHQDEKTKKLALTDFILFAVVAVSIVVGLVVANSMVDKANAANEAKIAEMQNNIKEVNLAESIYDMAADEVIDDVAVPTYSMEQLYALDLREPTGFTEQDLELITRRGLVGCEAAFVEAEETYGVNCIFLMSIASLESAYGTQMFRPNNMFGYGRTGFSSKQEGIMTVAKGLGTRYLNPSGSLYGGSPTLKGVNKRYAANPQWYYKVGKYMQGYYEELAAAKNGALDKFE